MKLWKILDNPICFYGLCVACVAFVIGMALLQPYMEAKTYRKLTGADVTTWDAIWVELRVQDAPRDKQPRGNQ
jgi:hypothetical protein